MHYTPLYEPLFLQSCLCRWHCSCFLHLNPSGLCRGRLGEREGVYWGPPLCLSERRHICNPTWEAASLLTHRPGGVSAEGRSKGCPCATLSRVLRTQAKGPRATMPARGTVAHPRVHWGQRSTRRAGTRIPFFILSQNQRLPMLQVPHTTSAQILYLTAPERSGSSFFQSRSV